MNGIRPSIKFTVEIEQNSILPFLDVLVQCKVDGHLGFSVYRKPTHTGRYLHFGSHQPSHVKRGVVRSLYLRAEKITLDGDLLEKERRRLRRMLNTNGYPNRFISRATMPRVHERSYEDRTQSNTICIPYVVDVSESIRRVCGEYGIRVIFKAGRSLCSSLMKVKDPLPLGKQSMVVYQIPCSCGLVYVGKTIRRLETRLKEHRDTCSKGNTERSAVAEHVWEHEHVIQWNDTVILDNAERHKEFLVKEALHICTTAKDRNFNRDQGIEVSRCWVTAITNHESKTHHLQTNCL